ncbi:hypothetical protein [Streptomyces sp. NPDC058086]|uniref:hypothetical protein n=1 Tax=Streptomyces sp. NPDC058086 TaxID=3346334 RepID=UPI0036EC28DA
MTIFATTSFPSVYREPVTELSDLLVAYAVRKPACRTPGAPEPTGPNSIRKRAGTTADLRAARALAEPVQLPDFMDGYWAVWLPDGEISLG